MNRVISVLMKRSKHPYVLAACLFPPAASSSVPKIPRETGILVCVLFTPPHTGPRQALSQKYGTTMASNRARTVFYAKTPPLHEIPSCQVAPEDLRGERIDGSVARRGGPATAFLLRMPFMYSTAPNLEGHAGGNMAGQADAGNNFTLPWHVFLPVSG